MSRRDKEDRHIPNCMLDFGAFIAQSSLEAQGFEASPTFKQLQQDTRTWIHRNVELIVKSFPPSSQFSPKSVRGKAKSDSSIYVGCGGNAYLHWKLTSFFEAEGDSEKVEFHRKSALTAIGVALSLLPPKPEEEGEGIAFYIGSAGIHALATVIFWMSGHLSETEKQMRHLLSYLGSSLSERAPDEVLYGRAGFLSSLLFVRKHVSKEFCARVGLEAAARQVFDAIMTSGKRNSGVKPSETGPLVYHFYGTNYLGAAHGTSGILYILLQFPEWCEEPANKPWITATLESILNSQFPSGNFPAQFNEKTDRLVHWCHGAPGVVYTLYHAHKVLGQDKTILRSLDLALGNIWEKGLLKKGFGTCHGIAGNAYAFLLVYRHTKAEELLYRAHKMAEAMRSDEIGKAVEAFIDPQRKTIGVPDYPYSLMEGLAGTICYCCDLLHPDTAAFPGYEGDI